MSESFLSFHTLKLQERGNYKLVRVLQIKKIIERDDDGDDHLQDIDMGIATASPFPPILPHSKTHHQLSSPILQNTNSSTSNYNSMSQDYHQGIFSFSNGGFERPSVSHQEHVQQQQHHIAQQIRRDKLRVQSGYEQPPPALLGIEEEESGGLPVYETAGMLSEMFNFPPAGGPAAAVDLLDQPLRSNYRTQTRQQQPVTTNDWYNSNNRQGMVVGGLGIGNSKNHSNTDSRESLAQHQHQISGINADSAAAMQLFLMNPSQPRSPQSPSLSHHQPPPSTSSTLHMLLPNPSSSLQGFSAVSGGGYGATSVISPPQFTWVPDSSHEGGNAGAPLNNPAEISGVVEAQGLSLSLSSSLQHLEAAKAEELRMGDGGLLYYNQGAGGSSSSTYYKNLGGHQHHQALHLQGGMGQNHHQVHVGFGSSLGVVNVLRNSKYVKAAQELLEEFCSVGRGQFKKSKFGRQNTNPSSNNNPGGGGSSSSTKDFPPLSAADRIEHQRRKVDRRYNHYCEQMQMVVNSFDLVLGFGAAVPYTALAQKAMSRHFRCLKDAVAAQLKHSCELLGDKDGAGTSGITKGETPRLKLLEQSLRQQRAFHQMGMMEQEAWRPQRGLPERSVNILRAWLFEHFLHPYPSDADKHLLARQTGFGCGNPWLKKCTSKNPKRRNQEQMIEKGSKPATIMALHKHQRLLQQRQDHQHQLPQQQPCHQEKDPKSMPVKTTLHSLQSIDNVSRKTKRNSPPPPLPPPPPLLHPPTSPPPPRLHRRLMLDSLSTTSPTTHVDTAALVTADYGTTSSNANAGAEHIGSTLLRFGTTTAGDVSLTLGLRHAGKMPEKSPPFSVRDFGGC
uniref:POX domain-containing protein n=1 Tax=Salix viminalis TaxID=40686 RepID=A0A6N2LQD7_SALVM